MTKKAFEKEVARLLRRLQLLRAHVKGEDTLRRVWVEPHKVTAYRVRGHYRYIAKGKSR